MFDVAPAQALSSGGLAFLALFQKEYFMFYCPHGHNKQ